jgi:hypothetical protein
MQTRLDVRAVPIPHGLADIAGAHHLFVVWTGEDGREMYLRGGPGNPKLGPGQDDSWNYGAIKCLWGAYVPGTVDWDPAAKSITAAVGYAPGTWDRLVALCQTIQFQGIAYKPTGPNSNTVAKTLLAALGVPPRKPGVLAPGWDDPPLAR